MSRSYRKTPICDMTTTARDKALKKAEHRVTCFPASASALVATKEGGLELALANGDDGDDIAPNVRLLCAVLIRSKNSEWVSEMINWLKSYGVKTGS